MRRERLVAARKAIGKSQEDVAEDVGVDRTTVGTWERGERTPQPYQRSTYADSLEITLTELDAMLSHVPNPSDRTPVWLSQLLGMEQSATEIQAHEPHVVLGLLQTPDYAAAIGRSVGVAGSSEEYARRNTEQREWRQARINSRDLSLHVVQPEIPLRLKMGSADVMAGQMAKLVDMGGRPNVTIQIVPYYVGQYEALRMGNFSIMTHPWVRGLTVYHFPYPRPVLIEDVDEAANYVAAWEQAATVALSPDDSLTFIREVEQQWRQS